jgi:transcriptional regulator with XRE-family HTH domain
MTLLTHNFGSQVKANRKALKLTQVQLASKAFISVSCVGEIERATKSPSLDQVERISRALNVQPEQLLRYVYDK